MRRVKQHFKVNDPVVYSVIKKGYKLEKLRPIDEKDYFLRLVREIIFQQLSGKAGNTIYSRFEQLFPQKKVTPANVLAKSPEEIRKAGVSNAKARYIHNLAEAVVCKSLRFQEYKNMGNEEIAKNLIQVKGIGRWTAEMFLMFSMGREDLFSHGDVGLRNGLMRLYGLKGKPTTEDVEKIIYRWSPYKTYGCLLLWGSLEQD